MPPSASSKSPARSRTAPVNAPRAWPKSSASSSSSVSAAQFTVDSRRCRRGPAACSARATSSLPEPLSPSTSTWNGAAATRSTRARSARIASLAPSSPSVSADAGLARVDGARFGEAQRVRRHRGGRGDEEQLGVASIGRRLGVPRAAQRADRLAAAAQRHRRRRRPARRRARRALRCRRAACARCVRWRAPARRRRRRDAPTPCRPATARAPTRRAPRRRSPAGDRARCRRRARAPASCLPHRRRARAAPAGPTT